MILIGVALLIALALAIIAVVYGNEVIEAAGYTTLIFTGFAVCIYSMACVFYMGAGHKADMLNREFGTQYTQEEVFWAEDIIEEVREMKRYRYEINGNLLRGGE